ncbi:hypothetical protein DK26_26305 [Bosea sp. WAO]|nr:hypothetical protein DK26_26305 [Bosea sp. WAO]
MNLTCLWTILARLMPACVAKAKSDLQPALQAGLQVRNSLRDLRAASGTDIGRAMDESRTRC